MGRHRIELMKDLQPIILGGAEPAHPIVIAGPCSAETEEQTLATARLLAADGIKIFRAGIWKPRTMPGGFEGVGLPGLKWLRRVKDETGMSVATEVATAAHVKAALAEGVDLFWIGARTTANPFAVQEIADALAAADVDVPVLVKNPLNPDLELWIGAMQRLYNAGVRRIGAIHRGFSAYGRHIYRNLPQWHVPIELRRRLPQLPLIHDPSHVGGKRELIASLAQQALDMDFDGLIIESHCNPDCALSDKDQQLTPGDLHHILGSLVFRDQKTTTESLNMLRRQIDSIDSELIDILNRRMNVSREIGQYKKEHRMPVFQVDRHDDVLKSRIRLAKDMGLDEDFMKTILSAIHEESVRLQLSQSRPS